MSEITSKTGAPSGEKLDLIDMTCKQVDNIYTGLCNVAHKGPSYAWGNRCLQVIDPVLSA